MHSFLLRAGTARDPLFAPVQSDSFRQPEFIRQQNAMPVHPFVSLRFLAKANHFLRGGDKQKPGFGHATGILSETSRGWLLDFRPIAGGEW